MDIMGKNKVTIAGSTTLTLAGETTIYTDAIYIGAAKFFGVTYSAVSAAGGISVKIEAEQADVLPTTENASDANYSEPENIADVVSNLTVESTVYKKSLALIPLPYVRFKITGLAGNSADTIVTINLLKQEAA